MGRKKLPPPEQTDTTPPAVAPAEAEEVARLRAMTAEQRIDQVMRWIVAGHRDIDIAETIAQAWPGIKAEKMLREILGKFQDAGETPPAFIRGWVYAARMEIYRQLIEIGDYAAALRALRDIEEAAK